MNEKIIVVGENKDGPGHYAMMANGNVVYSGNTEIEAIKYLLEEVLSKEIAVKGESPELEE